MKVFAVCGIKNSGKTTTVEGIIRELTVRGNRVGSIKNIHCEDFKMDPSLTSDTSRHRTVGSQLICAYAKQETSLMFPYRLSTEKILTFYQDVCDWVVCEGNTDLTLPTIVTAHSQEDLLVKWNDQVFCISGVISTSIEGYNGIPAINSIDKINDLVDLIEDNVQGWQPLT